MICNYTAKYTRLSTGYMGQLVDWPEIITEAKTIEQCRELLKDALHEMILAYHFSSKFQSKFSVRQKD
jgi:predicted RNase H-like HicB family nuclease